MREIEGFGWAAGEERRHLTAGAHSRRPNESAITIALLSIQVAIAAPLLSQIVSGDPPVTGVRTIRVPARKPIQRPSGEKNGYCPLSLPATGTGSARSRERR